MKSHKPILLVKNLNIHQYYTVFDFTVVGEQLRISPFSNWNAIIITFENIGRSWILIVSFSTLFSFAALFSSFYWFIELYVIESNPCSRYVCISWLLPPKSAMHAGSFFQVNNTQYTAWVKTFAKKAVDVRRWCGWLGNFNTTPWHTWIIHLGIQSSKVSQLSPSSLKK